MRAPGVLGGLVTGKSAIFQQSREFKSYTLEALPVAVPSLASVRPAIAGPLVTVASPR
jgi:hypothetical protein